VPQPAGPLKISLDWGVMTPPRALLSAAESLGGRIVSIAPIAGGDISDSFLVQLGGGEALFAKVNEAAPPDMFEVEARGLRALAARGSAVLIPEVRYVAQHCLVLQYLERSDIDHSETLGHALAQLHSAAWAERPGWNCDGYIGTLPQRNHVSADETDWPSFFRDHRLKAQLELPHARQLIPRRLRAALEGLMDRISDIVDPHTPLCLIHGDLWSGNHMFTRRGPAIFDPACYLGAAEVDLAMMRLFGGFSERTYHSYFEVRPTEPDLERRLLLYQLYPLLVHVNLFGRGYVGPVERNLRGLM